MSVSSRTHKKGSKRRYKFRVYNLHFGLYSQWGAQSIREVKKRHEFLLFGWNTWKRDGDARAFSVWTQSEVDEVDTLEGPYQPNISAAGRKKWIRHDTGILPTTNNGIIMTYRWDGKDYELDTGINWYTLIPSVAAIIIVLFLVGFWVVAWYHRMAGTTIA